MVRKKYTMIKNMKILLGTFLMAVAYKGIYESAGMVTGGFSGIGIVVRRLGEIIFGYGIPLWITNLVLNLPLFVAAFKIEGGMFVKNTVFGTIFLTIFLAVFPTLPIQHIDPLLVSLFGGIIGGTGIGLILREGATTGGTDMCAYLLHRKIRTYSIPQIMQVLDAMVILSGFILFGLEASLYSIIAVYVMSLVSDGISEGFKRARVVYIISDRYLSIAEELSERQKRGVTIIQVRGYYADVERKMIMCVVSKKQIPSVCDMVRLIDDKSFLIIGDVREVLGEGFVQM